MLQLKLLFLKWRKTMPYPQQNFNLSFVYCRDCLFEVLTGIHDILVPTIYAWTFRHRDIYAPGHLGPGTFRPRDIYALGHLGPGHLCPGTFRPGTFKHRDI